MINVKVSPTHPAMASASKQSRPGTKKTLIIIPDSYDEVNDDDDGDDDGNDDDDNYYTPAPSTPSSKSLTHACYNRYSVTNIRTETLKGKRAPEKVDVSSHKKQKTMDPSTHTGPEVKPESSGNINLRHILGISTAEAKKLAEHHLKVAKELMKDLNED